MDRAIIIFIGAFLNTTVVICAALKLLKIQPNIFNLKFIGSDLFMTSYLGTIYMTTDSYIKIISSYAFIVTILTIIYKIPIIRSSISAFLTLTLNLICEVIYVAVLTSVFNINVTILRNDIFGGLIHNIFILLMMYSVILIPSILEKMQNFIENCNENQIKRVILLLVLSTIIITMLVYYIYFDVNFIWALIFCIIFICAYTFLIVSIFLEKNRFIRMKKNYELMVESLSEYEKLYSYQRLLTHEFKNDLIVIRGMTNKNNKKLLSYIDERVNFKNNQDAEWLDKLKRIPKGGLLGILYYKILTSEQKDINVSFEIGRNFKTKNYEAISDEIKNKICKLLGIYMDNAIQAVEKNTKKYISITIDEFDNYMMFIIANNFRGNVDISKIYDVGYTTNETGKGYGLAIAKEIIDGENRIINNTQIVGDLFIQQVKIIM